MWTLIQILLWCSLVASVWYFRAKADRALIYGYSQGWDKGYERAADATSEALRNKVQEAFAEGWMAGFGIGSTPKEPRGHSSWFAELGAPTSPPKVSTPSHPFRPGSKQAQLVELLSDGSIRTAQNIGLHIYGEVSDRNTARAGSLIRSLRPEFNIVFQGGYYHMERSR